MAIEIFDIIRFAGLIIICGILYDLIKPLLKRNNKGIYVTSYIKNAKNQSLNYDEAKNAKNQSLNYDYLIKSILKIKTDTRTYKTELFNINVIGDEIDIRRFGSNYGEGTKTLKIEACFDKYIGDVGEYIKKVYLEANDGTEFVLSNCKVLSNVDVLQEVNLKNKDVKLGYIVVFLSSRLQVKMSSVSS